ncbi:MAG: radical SAM protein [Coriobacteriales bacterium]|nr:radical SAM protein [Coriobacteriales bacterium]
MTQAHESDSAPTRTASQAGWHVSRYNISAPIPNTRNVAIANLYKGTCASYTPIELYLLSVLDEIDEHHPIIERFARRGIIANFDERAALNVMGRAMCARTQTVGLTICPTMGCNFDCPYCFEEHGRGSMSEQVRQDVVALAERMAKASGAKQLHVTWFGGEPLLAPAVIESLSEQLIELANTYDMSYDAGIITNGYLLTPQIAGMLERCKVTRAQVTIDGLEDTHNATRHLAGGGATFDRIVQNLRQPNLPFRVDVRHNVHEGNKDEIEALRAFVKQLAQESGNQISYYPAPVSDSEVANERGKQVGLLCGGDMSEIGIAQEARRFSVGRGHYCGANSIWSVGIDDAGNLQKCWEAVDKPDISFGTAHDWDPADPFGTASNVDNLTQYLNLACPIADDECRECVWLPTCAGGCPHRRLYDQRACVAFKDNPQAYVLALYARIGENRKAKERKEVEERAQHDQ